MYRYIYIQIIKPNKNKKHQYNLMGNNEDQQKSMTLNKSMEANEKQ